MRIVVVDDSAGRVDKVSRLISEVVDPLLVSVVSCETADEARLALRDQCDLLILDVLLPKKKGQVPSARVSVDLLTELCDPEGRYPRPGLIFGLTADVSSLGLHQAEFARCATIVAEAPPNSDDWVGLLRSQVESVFASRSKVAQRVCDRVLISIHGIRTFGTWQGDFHEKVRSYSRDFEDFEVRYGFFDLVSFFIPPWRRRVSREMASRVVSIIERCSGPVKVTLVAHSFGTVIAKEALEILSRRSFDADVSTVIFCGSPIDAGESLDDAMSALAGNGVLINDCGSRDWVLALARTFVPGLGDAGRVGFRRENSSRFVNRFFHGGHALYFEGCKSGGHFVDRYWLGVVVGEMKPEVVDERCSYLGQDVVEAFLSMPGYVKAALALALAGAIWGMA